MRDYVTRGPSTASGLASRVGRRGSGPCRHVLGWSIAAASFCRWTVARDMAQPIRLQSRAQASAEVRCYSAACRADSDSRSGRIRWFLFHTRCCTRLHAAVASAIRVTMMEGCFKLRAIAREFRSSVFRVRHNSNGVCMTVIIVSCIYSYILALYLLCSCMVRECVELLLLCLLCVCFTPCLMISNNLINFRF